MANTNYRIVNPSDGDEYFDTAGTATTASTQPTINDGRVKGVRTADITSTLLNGVIAGNEGTKVTTGPKISNNLEITGGIAGGTFAYQAAGEYQIRRYSTLINGSSNNTLRSGGSDYNIRRSIHQRESVRTTRTAEAIRAGFWHQVSGIFASGLVPVDPISANDIGTWETRGVDRAANPSGENPGLLVYYHGSGNKATSDSYKQQYLW